MNLMDQVKGCIFGLSIADSIGSQVEFIHSKEDILTITGGKGVINLPSPALYTDDTQMTICIAEALLDSGDDMEKFMDALSKRFVEWYKLQNQPEHRRAPVHTCLTACLNLSHGVHWEQSGVQQSLGCGSAMRSAPIGLFFVKEEKIVDYGINSSKITHPNELALCSSVGTALATHFALNDEPVGSWANELIKIVSFNQDFKYAIRLAAEHAAKRTDPDYVLSSECLGEGWTGHEAVASALYCCMMNPDSYERAVLMAANTVGDSDSIACIAGAWMGAKLGFNKIPSGWTSKIENHEYLSKLADRIYNSRFGLTN